MLINFEPGENPVPTSVWADFEEMHNCCEHSPLRITRLEQIRLSSFLASATAPAGIRVKPESVEIGWLTPTNSPPSRMALMAMDNIQALAARNILAGQGPS